MERLLPTARKGNSLCSRSDDIIPTATGKTEEIIFIPSTSGNKILRLFQIQQQVRECEALKMITGRYAGVAVKISTESEACFQLRQPAPHMSSFIGWSLEPLYYLQCLWIRTFMSLFSQASLWRVYKLLPNSSMEGSVAN